MCGTGQLVLRLPAIQVSCSPCPPACLQGCDGLHHCVCVYVCVCVLLYSRAPTTAWLDIWSSSRLSVSHSPCHFLLSLTHCCFSSSRYLIFTVLIGLVIIVGRCLTGCV